MSLDQKIGQMVCERDASIMREKKRADWLRRYPVGSVFIGPEVIQAEGDRIERVRQNAARINQASRLPVLFCGDFEHGVGAEINGLTQLPHLMALGAVDDTRLAYEYGAVIAREALSIGARWSFSPVADLNLNLHNWVTNQRAVSDDPTHAIKILIPLIAGMQDHGVAVAFKHFPGDGTDDRNQHCVTSLQTQSFAQWQNTHGRVFQALINAGALSTMIGHIAFPAFEKPSPKTGRYRPATVSRRIMRDLLRRRMGFKGVIVTDALTMCGFCSWAPYEERIIDCVNAGADILLWPDTPRFFALMKRALRSGRINQRRVDDAVERVIAFKMRLGLFDAGSAFCPELSSAQRAAHAKTAQKVAERALTLLRNRRGLLPLKLSKRAKALMLIAQNTPVEPQKFAVFKSEFEKRGLQLTLAALENFADYRDRLDSFDVILLAGNVGTLNAQGSVSLVGKAAYVIWSLMARGEKKIVGISFGTPYFLREIDSIDTYINAYSNCAASQRAVAAALFGEVPFKGRSPVACPFVFERGV